jgi:hypothetical protein
VLYRKGDGARPLHEHGVLARFRYNDLKEAARAADAGPNGVNQDLLGIGPRLLHKFCHQKDDSIPHEDGDHNR